MNNTDPTESELSVFEPEVREKIRMELSKKRRDRELRAVAGIVTALAMITAYVPEALVDLLAGHLWDDEEAGEIKQKLISKTIL